MECSTNGLSCVHFHYYEWLSWDCGTELWSCTVIGGLYIICQHNSSKQLANMSDISSNVNNGTSLQRELYCKLSLAVNTGAVHEPLSDKGAV